MQFLVIGRDDTDDEALMRRNDARAAHLELSARMMREGNSLFGAAILDDAGTMAGSAMVVEFESRKDVDAWLKVEPYVTGGVWKTYSVEETKVAPHFLAK